MEKFPIILILAAMIISAINGSEDIYCRVLDTFTVCQKANVLTFVNQTQKKINLELKFDNIRAIAPNTFQDLSITNLTLDFGRFNGKPGAVDLNQESFRGLPSVVLLQLRNTIFPMEPNPFKHLISLEYLLLVDGEIGELCPNFFADLPNLKTFFVRGHAVSAITVNVFSRLNPGIQALGVDDGNLQTIEPKSLDRFTQMKLLIMAEDSFTNYVPGKFEGLGKLDQLWLASYKITVLPEDIFKGLPKLKLLLLQSTGIVRLEPSIFSGLNVDDLVLEFNANLRDLPAGVFNGLRQLKNLELRNNDLTIVSNNVFNHLLSLKTLDLQWNNISRIEPSSFSGSVIEYLALRGNSLRILEADTFNGLDVKTLNLSENRINVIKPQAFRNLTVEKILLYRNEINQIDRRSWGLSDSVEIITK